MSPVVYQLRLPPQWNIHPAFHASLLTPYVETKEHGKSYTRPPPDMIEGEAEYEVEVIRAHRHQRRKLQYLIKWKGYPESDNTWEPAGNVQAPQLIRKYHTTHPPEDKRTTEQARATSLTHPTWLPLTPRPTTTTPPTLQPSSGTLRLQRGTSTTTPLNHLHQRRRPNTARPRKANPRSSTVKLMLLSVATPSASST